ncbi:MAG: inorganic phosphate transporter [Methylococcales bacterium]|jgi:inorganic phosphate transporter, PiT family|nr:inorganic phosphate transporter [Methylococcales bacterium]
MELKNVNKIEKVTSGNQAAIFRIGVGLLFLVGVMQFTGFLSAGSDNTMLMIAAVIGGYMAMNIGANDVANNVGPAVGSQALTLTGAIIIAAVFEASGALLAGGEVVGTIKKGIIDPAMITNADTFIWLMMAALLAGGVWLNIATALGAPVSTTHSIVGGVLGAGIAAGGLGIANWDKMAAIAASWVISPVLGGLIAAGFLYLIKHSITYKEDMLTAAKKMVPILIAVMATAFATYLALKGLKKIWKIDFITASGIGLVVGFIVYLGVKPMVSKAAHQLVNEKASINQLFTIPLIFSAALLSFAHGANDVANAVGPLAAISDVVVNGNISAKAPIPLWVMMVGAIGIALGLALYGPKLIRTVGSEITELDKMRAFCIAMAAAITVIIASQLGLPVSSTHIAVGGIFGIGFIREYLKRSYDHMVDEIKLHHEADSPEVIESFLLKFKAASVPKKQILLKQLKDKASQAHFTKKERKQLKRVYKYELVKRSHLIKIAAAWVITVPASGLLAAFIFFAIRGMMIPM